MRDNFFPFPNAAILLSDGSVFYGFGIGKPQISCGELCFNTAMTGYQEIISDPSYAGQIITFTAPHIGNVGCNDEDIEANIPVASGIIIRENITNPSNYRSQYHLQDWLFDNGIVGISGIDTRRLTRHIRLNGAQNAAIGYFENFDNIDLDAMQSELDATPSLSGLDLAIGNSCAKPRIVDQGRWRHGQGFSGAGGGNKRIALIDYGLKENIARCLADIGFEVEVLPCITKAEAIIKAEYDAVVLSNGPGDPAATGEHAIPVIQQILEAQIPIMGICLGHQMLGLALGAKTEKMFQGHHGANHPVKDLRTGRVLITSQNHGFVISRDDLPDDIEVTHISLFDNSIQGIRSTRYPAFSLQGHPEATPGPHDAIYLFREFAKDLSQR